MSMPVNTDICHECINLIKTSNKALPKHIAKWLSNQREKLVTNPILLKIAEDNDIPMLFKSIRIDRIRLYLNSKKPNFDASLLSYEQLIRIKQSPIYEYIDHKLFEQSVHTTTHKKYDEYIQCINQCIECVKNNIHISNDMITKLQNIKLAIKRNPTKFNGILIHAYQSSEKFNIWNPLTSSIKKQYKTKTSTKSDASLTRSLTRSNVVVKLKQYAEYIDKYGTIPNDIKFKSFTRRFIKTYAHKTIHPYSNILNELGITDYFSIPKPKIHTPKHTKPTIIFDLNNAHESNEFKAYLNFIQSNEEPPMEDHQNTWVKTFKRMVNDAIKNNTITQTTINHIYINKLEHVVIKPINRLRIKKTIPLNKAKLEFMNIVTKYCINNDINISKLEISAEEINKEYIKLTAYNVFDNINSTLTQFDNFNNNADNLAFKLPDKYITAMLKKYLYDYSQITKRINKLDH